MKIFLCFFIVFETIRLVATVGPTASCIRSAVFEALCQGAGGAEYRGVA